MLNQLLHLAGRTWQSPPSAATEPDDIDAFEDRFQTAPPQMGDLYA